MLVIATIINNISRNSISNLKKAGTRAIKAMRIIRAMGDTSHTVATKVTNHFILVDNNNNNNNNSIKVIPASRATYKITPKVLHRKE